MLYIVFDDERDFLIRAHSTVWFALDEYYKSIRAIFGELVPMPEKVGVVSGLFGGARYWGIVDDDEGMSFFVKDLKKAIVYWESDWDCEVVDYDFNYDAGYACRVRP